jgi:type II secretory pathway pseudopilin PulG
MLTPSVHERSLSSRKGQTLIEALVALTVLTIGFVGIVTLLAKSFQLNRITSEDTQATYLAEEGVELVKNLADHDVYAGIAGGGSGVTNWGASFPPAGSFCANNCYYEIDYKTTSISPSVVFPSAQSTPLEIGPENGSADADMYAYTIAGGTPTDFVRNIKVSRVSTGPGNTFALQVISSVSWSSGIFSDTVSVEDYFYAWHP